MPAPQPRLEIAPYDFAAARALARELGVSHELAQVLVRRGMDDPVAARAWLAADEEHAPSAFAGIADAVELISRHLDDGSHVTVHGDYDVDGVCSTAILVSALRRRAAPDTRVDWLLPSRLEDGYGLTASTVERLRERGTRLLVTADCAITAVEEVAAARAAGIDVVVTDHHAARADGSLPDAPIVHPVVCDYPCRELCAAGVAFKLAQALEESAASPDGATARAWEGDLDLVALATVADVVPLRGENRRLVRAGLRALAATAKPGLRALMEVSQLDPGRLDAHALSFRLAPRINAAGRLQRADAGLELLLCDDEARAAQIARELDSVNAERRLIETRILFEAEAQIGRAPERLGHVVAGEGWHPGVVGIVASRLAERHHRPTVVIGLSGGEGRGSARSIPGFDLLAALDECAATLSRYGGHRAAAGLELARDSIGELSERFEAVCARRLEPEDLVPRETVDAVVSGDALGHALAEELAALEPCGAGNPTPTLMLPAAALGDVRPIGEGKHARFTVRSGGARARAVAFGCGGRLAVAPDEPADATFRLELNEYRGAVEPRLVLRSARLSEPAPVVALGEPADFLAGVAAALSEPAAPPGPGAAAGARERMDRRGRGIAGTLSDLVHSGSPVLAVCADTPLRLAGLGGRLGGFALGSYAALEREPQLAAEYVHVAAIDPPADAWQEHALAGAGAERFLHLCWGPPEVQLASGVHRREYDLRADLAVLYRALLAQGPQSGAALEALLCDGGRRSPALAGRLLRVLSELELVVVDSGEDAAALRAEVRASMQTTLERSIAFKLYTERYESGLRFLETRTAQAA